MGNVKIKGTKKTRANWYPCKMTCYEGHAVMKYFTKYSGKVVYIDTTQKAHAFAFYKGNGLHHNGIIHSIIPSAPLKAIKKHYNIEPTPQPTLPWIDRIWTTYGLIMSLLLLIMLVSGPFEINDDLNTFGEGVFLFSGFIFVWGVCGCMNMFLMGNEGTEIESENPFSLSWIPWV